MTALVLDDDIIEDPVPAWRRPALSRREVEVVKTWIAVDSKGEACSELFISVGTMNTHLLRVRSKYLKVGRPAPTKSSLLARFIQDGLIDLEAL
ncbi:helix-turn-helix transcriptional regulator [Smaragdicoccus niigatensis]|uniref:helix-turn-helix transcriptional regulator n=1 Tax=Smaragdicoccus niigatensis TaxID=359359 RepID=UPI0003774D8E|nr:hypothetical protein [Smaragdicoccus niigatensis]